MKRSGSELYAHLARQLRDLESIHSAVEARRLAAIAAARLPPGPIWKELAVMWVEAGAPPPMAPGDNFFTAGGRSLAFAQLVARASEHFAVRLDLRELFARPTLEALATAVERGLADRP
jgi:hypothetical protein